jgi:hypothetical protein
MKDKGQRTRDGVTEDGKKSSKEDRNNGIWSHWDSVLSKRLCSIMEGSGSVPLNNGSGSGTLTGTVLYSIFISTVKFSYL